MEKEKENINGSDRVLRKYLFLISFFKGITTNTYKVLLYLISSIGFSHEYTEVKQMKIGLKLDLSRSQISEAFSVLLKLGLLELDPKSINNRIRSYRLRSYTEDELDERIYGL